MDLLAESRRATDLCCDDLPHRERTSPSLRSRTTMPRQSNIYARSIARACIPTALCFLVFGCDASHPLPEIDLGPARQLVYVTGGGADHQ